MELTPLSGVPFCYISAISPLTPILIDSGASKSVANISRPDIRGLLRGSPGNHVSAYSPHDDPCFYLTRLF